MEIIYAPLIFIAIVIIVIGYFVVMGRPPKG